MVASGGGAVSFARGTPFWGEGRCRRSLSFLYSNRARNLGLPRVGRPQIKTLRLRVGTGVPHP